MTITPAPIVVIDRGTMVCHLPTFVVVWSTRPRVWSRYVRLGWT